MEKVFSQGSLVRFLLPCPDISTIPMPCHTLFHSLVVKRCLWHRNKCLAYLDESMNIWANYPGIDWGLSRTPLTGGGGGSPLLRIISETRRGSETGEARFEGSRRDAPNPFLTF